MKHGVRHLVSPFINDGLRGVIGLLIGRCGFAMAILHWARIATFPGNQKRLRRRYRVNEDSPILSYGPELQQHIQSVATGYRTVGLETMYAQTSGSSSSPKHILYTNPRLRSVRRMFMDAFVRSFRAYRVRRKSLYVFSAFEADQSLTSMLREEPRLPSYLVTLQAPYRVERHPAVRELVERYGATAVQFWVLVISNPGVLYGTNPSTIWLFFHELATKWNQSTLLIRDFQNHPEGFSTGLHQVARRLESIGSAARLSRVAASDQYLPVRVTMPALEAYMCWAGGYVQPFLDRLETYLPPERYRRIPMLSMSTESTETIGHYLRDDTFFVPMASGVLYEFIEEGTPDRPENLKSATELQPMTAYTMVVSDAFGLRRYQTEDVFFCNGYYRKLPDLRFVRRRNLEYSFTGEKLSAEQLSDVFVRLRNEYRGLPEDVFLTCVPSLPPGDWLPHYKLVLVGGPENVVLAFGDALAARCDVMLGEVNGEYGNKRRSGRLGIMRLEHRSFDDFIGCFEAENQFKFLPLYRRTWEVLVSKPAGVLCV